MQSNTLTRVLAGGSVATTNDLAHIDIGYRCKLIAFQLRVSANNPATADGIIAQLSVSSNGAFGNDSQGVIGEISESYQLTTSGVGQFNEVLALSGLSILLPAGTRLYLHTYQTGTTNTAVSAIVHLQPY